MTMSKAPITLALFGMLFVMFLLFAILDNEFLAKLSPRSYYPHDRQYEALEVKAVLGLAALTQWLPALSANRPPFQYIAFELLGSPPEALWFTQEQSLSVASGACVVGIYDPKIRVWATKISGLPIFWDLKPNSEASNWSNGRILDLEAL